MNYVLRQDNLYWDGSIWVQKPELARTYKTHMSAVQAKNGRFGRTNDRVQVVFNGNLANVPTEAVKHPKRMTIERAFIEVGCRYRVIECGYDKDIIDDGSPLTVRVVLEEA